MESIKEVWEGVERYLRTVDGMPQVVFDVWIAGIEPYAIKDGEMVVYVNTNYQRRIILENYAERIMNAFQHVLGIPLGLKIIAREVPAVETKQETPAAPETAAEAIDMPLSRRASANCTIRIAFLANRPISMISAICK